MGDDDSKALVYIAIGAVAAVGAGYLIWRYGMSEQSRQRTVEALKEGSRKAMQTAKGLAGSAKEAMGGVADHAMDGASKVRSKAMASAGELGQRLRP